VLFKVSITSLLVVGNFYYNSPLNIEFWVILCYDNGRMLDAYGLYTFCSISGLELKRKWLHERSRRRGCTIPYPLDSVFWQKYNLSLHCLLKSCSDKKMYDL